MNAIILPPDHQRLVEDIRTRLGNWHRFTVAIDGRDGAGKSTLARLLAYQLNMPAIETDLFLTPNSGDPKYRYEELDKAVASRHVLNRPVIVEGIMVLETLSRIGVSYDYLIYTHNLEAEGSVSLASTFHEYELKYSPREQANFVYQVGNVT